MLTKVIEQSKIDHFTKWFDRAERLSRLLEMDAREQGRPSVRPLQGVCRQADCRGRCHLLSGL